MLDAGMFPQFLEFSRFCVSCWQTSSVPDFTVPAVSLGRPPAVHRVAGPLAGSHRDLRCATIVMLRPSCLADVSICGTSAPSHCSNRPNSVRLLHVHGNIMVTDLPSRLQKRTA